MENVIEISNLNKKYDTFQLKDVNLAVAKGSVMGVVGENGAGKTTLIRLMFNMIHKDSGSIKIFGMDSVKDEKKIKEQTAMVMDDAFFYENIKAEEISSIMSSLVKSWDDRLFREYMDRFELPAGKIVKDFSKGMRAKIRIITAMARRPKLLILDEATSSLDPIVRNEILDLFRDFMQEEEHSIFMSSHITGDLEKTADYITFINKGRIVFSEPKDDLLYDYGILKCGASDFNRIDRSDIKGVRKNSFGCEILISDRKAVQSRYPEFIIDNVTIEEIMLFKVRGEKI